MSQQLLSFAAGTLTPGTLTASVNGYVSESTTTVVTSTTTQQTVNVDSSAGGIAELPFALKTTVSSSGSNISGATVKAGSSYAISCSENGTTGVYYCIIPTDASTNVYATKTGYYDNTSNYSARTANSSAQATAGVTLTAVRNQRC